MFGDTLSPNFWKYMRVKMFNSHKKNAFDSLYIEWDDRTPIFRKTYQDKFLFLFLSSLFIYRFLIQNIIYFFYFTHKITHVYFIYLFILSLHYIRWVQYALSFLPSSWSPMHRHHAILPPAHHASNLHA